MPRKPPTESGRAYVKSIRKDIAFTLKDAPGRDRAFWITASTEDIDRDGDRLMSDGWRLQNFMRNPVIPWAHKYDEPPVAKALSARVEDRRLKLLIQFATAEEYAFADTIYRLYKGGYLNAFSVGFSPIRSERVERNINGRKIWGRDFLEQELLEVSTVTIPSNPAALARAKAKGVISPCEFRDLHLIEEIYKIAGEVVQRRISNLVEKAIAKRFERSRIDKRLRERGVVS